jgi:hypothetical protein
MKKLLLTSALSVMTVAAFGQGTITQGNAFGASGIGLIYGPQTNGSTTVSITGNSSADTPTGTTVYAGPLLTGTGYDAAFYVGPTSATSYTQMTLLTLETTGFRTSTGGNKLPAGELTSLPADAVPGIPGDTAANGGQFANYQVFVWTTVNLDADPSFVAPVDATTAMADWAAGAIEFGSSPIETTSSTLGGGLQTAPQTLIPSFNLTLEPSGPSPEPASLALIGLGAGGMLLFRRKK